MENVTLADVGMVVAFLVALISGIAYLKKNLKDWISDAVRPELDSITGKVDALQADLDKMKADRKLDNANDARRQILIFNDELLRGTKHSKEHFDQVLLDVDHYERYCAKHEEYKNSRAVLAIEEIRRCYAKCEKEGTFL